MLPHVALSGEIIWKVGDAQPRPHNGSGGMREGRGLALKDVSSYQRQGHSSTCDSSLPSW